MNAAAGLMALAVAFAALFWHTFANLIPLWLNDPSYGHSGAVAVAILGFVGFRANKYPVADASPTQAGLAFGLAAAAQLVAVILGSSWAAMLAIVFVGRGMLLLVGGRDYAARFTFPLLLVAFLFPLPFTWTSYIALLLQNVVSQFSETVLGLFVVCTRTGHTIRIAGVDQSLVVAEECSGLRQILAFVACAAIIGALFHRRTLAHRIVLVLAAVPVAVAANVLRVVLMNLAAAEFGTTWMGGWMHDIPALFSLPVGIGLFFLADVLLFGVFGTPAAPPVPTPAPPATGVRRRMLVAAAVTLGLAAGNGLLFWHLSVAPANSSDFAAPLASTPLTFGETSDGWVGTDLVKQREDLLPKLQFRWDEVVLRQYVHTAKPVGLQLYMVYSRTGEDRKHHPEICIREVSGAPEDVAMRRKVTLAEPGRDGQRFRFLTRGDQSTVVYYWHYRLPPAPADRSMVQELHQRLAGAAPSVTVQVSLSGQRPADLELVETIFLPALDRAIRAAAPEGTVVACNRIPISLARD